MVICGQLMVIRVNLLNKWYLCAAKKICEIREIRGRKKPAFPLKMLL